MLHNSSARSVLKIRDPSFSWIILKYFKNLGCTSNEVLFICLSSIYSSWIILNYLINVRNVGCTSNEVFLSALILYIKLFLDYPELLDKC